MSTVLLLAVLSMAATACSYNSTTGGAEVYGIARFKLPVFPKTGSHAVIIFSEMHYQPSYAQQEGPRLLPPPDSVPVTGREVRYATLDEYRELTIPSRAALSYDPAAAAELFRVNCQVCHGSTGRGDGPMRKFITRGPVPADLTLPLTQDAPEGEVFAYISKGGRIGFASLSRGRESPSPMPPFQLLLTEDDRWSLVQYVLSR